MWDERSASVGSEVSQNCQNISRDARCIKYKQGLGETLLYQIQATGLAIMSVGDERESGQKDGRVDGGRRQLELEALTRT
jgi:hypothetical protein